MTFLFTDIEGSTKLLQEAGDSYPALLEDHRRLLRAAFAAHGGREVNTQGDSFFVAFPTPEGAVAAAADSQRALAAHDWPPGRHVHVRMGLHTGAITDVGRDYVGLEVHRAARIAAAAHGGQVVLSDATAALAREALPEGTALRDLGKHRLKDFPTPTRLFQLETPGLPGDFPALRTLLPTGRLPTPPASFVGREQAVEAVGGLLRDERVRLLTLTGPGGIGKTRLALEAARAVTDAFPGGVVFVPLAAVGDPGLVLGAVADAVGVRREGGVPLLQSVSDAIGERRTLLLLDNFEQVVAASPTVAALLEQMPAAVALVTSRQVLRIRGEQQYHVTPLAETAAARLFADRAAAASPGFVLTESNASAVAEIARRLDGLPLAIELAAARVRLLTPDSLLDRMDDRLSALGRGPVDLPERQRTLRATMDWSYGLLQPHERVVFARLAVFSGGCTLDAAETVCARRGEPDLLDTLSELLANSLLVTLDGDDDAPRLDMLETVRAYASEKLAVLPDRVETERRHTEWMLDTAAERLRLRGREHRTWFERFDRERANLRATMQRAIDAGDAATVARLARDTFVSLAHRDAEGEVIAWLDDALALREPAPPAVRGRLLVVRALAAMIFAEFTHARELLAQGQPLLPDDAEHVYDQALAASAAAYSAMADNPARAAHVIDEASHRLAAAGDELGRAYMVVTAGHRALHVGDLDTAARHYETAVDVAEDLGDDAMHGRALSLLGLTLLVRGDVDPARAAVIEGAVVNRRGGQPTGMAYSLDGLAALALSDGRPSVAARALAAAAAVRMHAGNPPSPAFAPLLEDLVSRCQTALGDDAYAQAGAEPEQWHAVEALDHTLAALHEPSG